MAQMTNLPFGWLNEREEKALRRLARGQIVLELGAYKGRSTVAMAEKALYVVSVDRHRGVPQDDTTDTIDAYFANTRDLQNVAKVVMEDWQLYVGLLFKPGVFGLVYIDGDHDYHSALRDAEIALSLDPAVVAFHDWDAEEVARAGKEVFGRVTGRADSLAWFKR